jgi:hypothetical protein
MCDYVAGEVLLSFPRERELIPIMNDWFIEHGPSEGLELDDTLEDRVRRAQLPDESIMETDLALWKVRVTPGDEVWAVNALRRHYQDTILRIDAHYGLERERFNRLVLNVDVSLNHQLSLSANSTEGLQVELSQTHQLYKQMTGLDDTAEPFAPVNVAIVDSGLSGGLDDRVLRRRDFLQSSELPPWEQIQAIDNIGHGSIIAGIIADIVPSARLVVYRVADTKSHPTEWDLCAALSAVADVDVINLSLAFGLDMPDCDLCGRSSNSSRSIVIEEILRSIQHLPRKPIVVAAAGNGSGGPLSYPARFGNVVATGSITSARIPSSFTNSGAIDHSRAAHPSLFFSPGGECLSGSEETVGQASDGATFWGTSFACAYTTAMVAHLRSNNTSDDIVAYMRTQCRQDIVGYSPALHGNGRLHMDANPLI